MWTHTHYDSHISLIMSHASEIPEAPPYLFSRMGNAPFSAYGTLEETNPFEVVTSYNAQSLFSYYVNSNLWSSPRRLSGETHPDPSNTMPFMFGMPDLS